MEVQCTGTAKFRIIETGEIVKISAENLDWQQDGGDERQMGAEYRYVADYEFNSRAGKPYYVSWELYEYPVGVENHNQTIYKEDQLELLEDVEFGLYHGPGRDDEE